MRDFRDAGDEPERSGAVNSLAAQEFGSDYTDPYLVRGAGIGFDLPTELSFRWQLDGAIERQDSVAVHARPVVREFAPTLPAAARRLFRVSLAGDRAPGLWLGGTELTAHADVRATWDRDPTMDPFGVSSALRTLRAAFAAEIERPVGNDRFVSHTTAAALWSSGFEPQQELVRLGGPVTAPGYDYHSLIGRAAVGEHVEWQFPVPFPSFSLGRFGHVPGTGALAPYVHAVLLERPLFAGSTTHVYPSVGAGLLTPFNLVRLDVARGLASGGRWTFGVDMSREFWSIF
jgi:hypothetical protein